jgi:signal transduction histidine kinase
MSQWTTSPKGEQRRFVRLLRCVVWLRRHRSVTTSLMAAGIAIAFLLDLVIPGYAIAGLYLFPLILVAFALRDRLIIVIVSMLCLALTVAVMILQGRANGQNILFICFGVLAGAGLIALGYLYNRFDQLYESQRSSTMRLQLLTAQLQKLQEISVLHSDRPLSELVDHIVGLARQLLASDVGALFSFDPDRARLDLRAADGVTAAASAELSLPLEEDPVSRSVLERQLVAVSDLTMPANGEARRRHLLPDDSQTGYGACLAVPLIARQELYGALALLYREPRLFNEEDIGIARSFADQAALAIENTRLREQVERSAMAAERSRLARDLHDSVTQSLFAASLKAEALRRHWEPASQAERESLDDLQRLTRGALAEMRTLLLEMRPSALAESWLGDLLRHLVDASQGRSRTSIELRVIGHRKLPPDVTIALYRIAQEAMNNVVRHAAARRAWVTLTCSEPTAQLVIGDSGCGFDQTIADSGQFGLRIMRERAEAVGAGLSIESERRRGTVVRAEWPDSGGCLNGPTP